MTVFKMGRVKGCETHVMIVESLGRESVGDTPPGNSI